MVLGEKEPQHLLEEVLGGSCGGAAYHVANSSSFGSTESYSVGAGGNGGVAQTTNATNGNSGITGSSTTFGNMIAPGGGNGSGGSTTLVTSVSAGSLYTQFAARLHQVVMEVLDK